MGKAAGSAQTGKRATGGQRLSSGKGCRRGNTEGGVGSAGGSSVPLCPLSWTDSPLAEQTSPRLDRILRDFWFALYRRHWSLLWMRGNPEDFLVFVPSGDSEARKRLFGSASRVGKGSPT